MFKTSNKISIDCNPLHMAGILQQFCFCSSSDPTCWSWTVQQLSHTAISSATQQYHQPMAVTGTRTFPKFADCLLGRNYISKVCLLSIRCFISRLSNSWWRYERRSTASTLRSYLTASSWRQTWQTEQHYLGWILVQGARIYLIKRAVKWSIARYIN